MTGSNHVVTGALIAIAAPVAPIAIPLAFVSHFVLDMMPHYGHETDDRYWLTKGYTRVLILDGVLCTAMLTALLTFKPENWALILLCGLAALLPDAVWLPYYMHDRKHPESKKRKRFDDVLKRIQWGERPWGIYVEAVWFIGTAALLAVTIS
jgi:hypothetical protein